MKRVEYFPYFSLKEVSRRLDIPYMRVWRIFSDTRDARSDEILAIAELAEAPIAQVAMDFGSLDTKTIVRAVAEEARRLALESCNDHDS